jgi:hypothetical protein
MSTGLFFIESGMITKVYVNFERDEKIYRIPGRLLRRTISVRSVEEMTANILFYMIVFE